MKKIVAMVVIALMVFSGCKEKGDSSQDDGTAKKVVGISKIVSHPALDAVEKGIQDELSEWGFNVKYNLQNANGDPTAAKTIANTFSATKVDIAVGIATPTSQALVSTLENIPVVFSAVTDPAAAGLVPSFEASGTNVTGYSDLTPVKSQIQFLMEMTEVKSVGHVYTSSEENAVILRDLAAEACEELGVTFVDTAVTKSAEVKQAAQFIAGKVDAIYVSTDNTVVSALPSIVDVANDNGIPIMSADPSSAETTGVLAAWGFDYYAMGRATGALVARILDGTDPGTIPTQFMTDPADSEILVNLDVAEKLGVELPGAVLEQATTIIDKGEITRK